MDYQTDEVSEKLVTIRQRSGQDDRKNSCGTIFEWTNTGDENLG